ncbi:DUF1652 domain-containing protein [Phytopseudomonas punonensis]|nr:DUF1652 domain-containing protein [Pseudomonas punonensis]
MSILEQRQIIESAFLPLNCRCTIGPDGTATIELRAPDDHRLLIRIADIPHHELSSSRGISQLVMRVRGQLALQERGAIGAQREAVSLA